MIVKSPCIIDISHWNTVDWSLLGGDVMAVVMKATQGKYYRDPTFGTSWIYAGARGLPRSAYHFFEVNDVSTQVENFLTACEDVGMIRGGIWQAEIEPVLDAEYIPPTLVNQIKQMLGVGPTIRESAQSDRSDPKVFIPLVTGAQLAAQYKMWLDLVEAEIHVVPIIYCSKWTWNYTGNPAWSSNYKLWVAQYPNSPDSQSAPAYLPTGWSDWWIWQYSESGALPGITGRVDMDVYNGTEEDFIAEYGGGAVPPEPPPPGDDTMITFATVKSPTLNVRSTPDLTANNVIGPKFLRKYDVLYGVEKTSTCIRFTKAKRAGVELTLPGTICWCSLGSNYIFQEWDVDITDVPPAGLPVSVKVTANGSQIHNKDVQSGGAVEIAITD